MNQAPLLLRQDLVEGLLQEVLLLRRRAPFAANLVEDHALHCLLHHLEVAAALVLLLLLLDLDEKAMNAACVAKDYPRLESDLQTLVELFLLWMTLLPGSLSECNSLLRPQAVDEELRR